LGVAVAKIPVPDRSPYRERQPTLDRNSTQASKWGPTRVAWAVELLQLLFCLVAFSLNVYNVAKYGVLLVDGLYYNLSNGSNAGVAIMAYPVIFGIEIIVTVLSALSRFRSRPVYVLRAILFFPFLIVSLFPASDTFQTKFVIAEVC
jgi:hypothetical protein